MEENYSGRPSILHAFLYMTGVEKYSGEHKKQQNSQTAVIRKDHKENTAKLAGVCKHADDTGSKNFLYCIHITYKTGSNGS